MGFGSDLFFFVLVCCNQVRGRILGGDEGKEASAVDVPGGWVVGELREVEQLVDGGGVGDDGGGVGGDAHNLLNDVACASSSRSSRR